MQPTNWHLILFIIIVALYFLPTIVARMRSHHQTLAIFLTNLFFGWTLLGWIAALIWSATAKRQPTVIIHNNNSSGQLDPRRQWQSTEEIAEFINNRRQQKSSEDIANFIRQAKETK